MFLATTLLERTNYLNLDIGVKQCMGLCQVKMVKDANLVVKGMVIEEGY
jgi:hypothetical protein